MKFEYQARTKEGELQVGNVEAANRDAAVNILLSHGLFVLTVQPVVESNWSERIMQFLRRVKMKDVMIFTRQFSTLLSSQVPLADSLNNLYRQTTNVTLRETIQEIRSDVESGFSLSQALEKHPDVFSEFYVNMVKSAEVTGRLSEVLDFLADSLERQSILVSKIQNALYYPLFVIILFVAVVIVLVTMVLPQLTPIFNEAAVDIPIFTRFLLATGSFITNFWWAAIIILGGVFLMIANYVGTREGKAVLQELSLRIPVIGQLFQKLYIARFAESCRVLVKGGLTIPQAVEISARTVGNVVYQDILHQAAEQIRKGVLLSKALSGISEVPPLVPQLLSVGESTGRIEELLEKINSFYTREVEDLVDNLVNLIQPVLMVVIGIMVAILFASILMPIFSLTQSF